MQYFHGAASESKLQVKVWLIAYRVDFWLMSCSSVPYSLLLTASNKYLQTESGDFKANEHNNTMSKLWCYGKYWQHLTISYMDTKAWSKVTDPTCSDTRKGEATLANRNLNWEKHHLPTLGILLVEPDRKKTLNWSKKKCLLAKRTLYSSSSLTWKRPRGNRQFSHLFIGWKGPRDDKTQNTHVLNSRASLGTSGNKMADKHRGLQLFATSH